MANIDYASLLTEEDQKALLEGRYEELSLDAKKLIAGGFSTGEVVQRGLERGVTSSARGIAQLAGYGDVYPDDAEKERQFRMMTETNPAAAIGSNVVGNIGDLVTLPVAFLKPLKAASAVGTAAMRGAAQGAFGGALEPTYQEYGDSRLMNVAAGTGLGAGLGAVIGKVLKKFGIDINEPGAEAKVKALSDEQKAAAKAEIEAEQAAVTRAPEEPTPTPKAEEPAPISPTREQAPYEKAMAPERQAELRSDVMDENQLTLVNNKLTEAEADIARAEERLYELQNKQQKQEQTAALFKGAPEELTPRGMGLLSPSTPSRGSQVAALFKATPKAEQAPIREAVKQEAKITSQQDYLQKLIENKQGEVVKYREMLQRHEQGLQKAQEAPKKAQPIPIPQQAPQEAVAPSMAPVEAEASLGLPKTQTSMGSAGTRFQAVYGPDLSPNVSKLSNEDILTSSAMGVDLADAEARAGLVSGSLKNIARRGDTLRNRVLKEDYNDLAEWMTDPKNQNRILTAEETAMIKPIVDDARANRMNVLERIQEYVANNDDLDTREAAKMVEDLLYYSGIDAFYRRSGSLASRAFNARKLIQMKLSKNQPLSSIFPTVSC